jgi:hypothetical protein
VPLAVDRSARSRDHSRPKQDRSEDDESLAAAPYSSDCVDGPPGLFVLPDRRSAIARSAVTVFSGVPIISVRSREQPINIACVLPISFSDVRHQDRKEKRKRTRERKVNTKSTRRPSSYVDLLPLLLPCRSPPVAQQRARHHDHHLPDSPLHPTAGWTLPRSPIPRRRSRAPRRRFRSVRAHLPEARRRRGRD